MNNNLKRSLLSDLKFRLSLAIPAALALVCVLALALHLSWSYFESKSIENRLVDGLATVIQPDIEHSDLINLRRILQSFRITNTGANFCIRLFDNIEIADAPCKSNYKAFKVPMSNTSYFIAADIPYQNSMGITGLFILICTLILVVTVYITIRNITSRISSDLKSLYDTDINLIAEFNYMELNIASEKIREGLISKLSSEKAKAHIEMGLLASQVSHDIRSPLSALSMVIATLKEIPEDKRILIRNATQRINDIANDLLQKGNKSQSEESFSHEANAEIEKVSVKKINLSTQFIPVLIDILVSEKRMQFREYSGLEIEVDLKDSFGAFAHVNSNDLKRVISNLVNNAVEAFPNHQGRIIVGVKKIVPDAVACKGNVKTKKIEISIKDNGRGIPKHILEKLGQFGVTHGKEGTQSGSGLGVYHAKKTAESFGGTFEIDSIEGKGTIIRIILPLAEPPIWFANKIDLTGKSYLVSLDDDISIHQIWSGRLSSLGFNNIAHLRFQSGETFKQYVDSNIIKLKESLFLVDYELLNQTLTGLDVIAELGIEKYSVLVTSRYEESAIQERASRLQLPILPKALAGFVPFEMQQPKEVYDWVLLDNDELVKMTWELAAKENNKSFKFFSTPEDFDAYKGKLAFEQKIFIDSSLNHGVKGEDVARKLFAEGFKSLYLATGYTADHFPAMDFIKAVVGKEPPRY